MRKPIRTVFLSLLCVAGSAAAQTLPGIMAGANVANGRTLHQEKNCAACHAQQLGGDGARMYTRPERKVKSPDKLIAQVAACNTRLRAELFPEDERDIAAYLNQNYYKFK
jgi:mono/diheme cytochrome c family protein